MDEMGIINTRKVQTILEVAINSLRTAQTMSGQGELIVTQHTLTLVRSAEAILYELVPTPPLMAVSPVPVEPPDVPPLGAV